MTIYIETFLIQNTLINFCLLKLVNLTTKCQTKIFKLIISSIFGAIFSVISAIFLTNNILINLLKLFCAMLMIFLSFKQNIKYYIFNLILLFIYTFAYGGAITALSSSVYLTSFGAVMSSRFSLESITIFIIVLTLIFEQVSKQIKYNIKTAKYIYKTAIYKNNQKIIINTFLDTGNLLQHNDKPVIVIDFNSYLKLTNNNLYEYFKQTNTLNANTVSGTNSMKIFKIDKLEIFLNKKKITLENQYIAVSNKAFNDKKYQGLLSPLFF